MNMLSTALEFRCVSKGFAQPDSRDLQVAINDVSFNVRKGEFLAIVGPSGCGKSTILNMTAGLYQPTEGEVYVSGEKVNSPNSHVGFMLQKDLLLPWRNIVRNVEFGLEARGMAKDERRTVALKELKRCHLEEFANHYPYQLSGGMRQRAALARTLAINPDIILLDEPFSALDAQTKLLLQQNFGETIMGSGVTTVLITHDLSEAVFMADRIVVLSERPANVIEEIVIDLPHRGNLLERRKCPEATDYISRLFNLLKLEKRAL